MSDKLSDNDFNEEELPPFEELISNNTLFLKQYLNETRESLSDLLNKLEVRKPPLLVLEHLCLADVNFITDELEKFLTFINLPKLKEIDLSNCELKKSDLILLNNLIPSMKELVYIDLYGNSPSQFSEEFDILSNLMINCPINTLNLTASNLQDVNVNKLSVSLANSATLSEYDLSRNFLNYESCFGIKRVLSSQITPLKILSLSNNNLTDKALKVISIGLVKNKHLEELTLNLNKFENLTFLDSSLLHNKKINYLDLLANNIGTRGKTQLMSSLKNPYGIKSLFLANNPISLANFKAIIKQSKYNTNLSLVDLIETNVTYKSNEFNVIKDGLRIIIG